VLVADVGGGCPLGWASAGTENVTRSNPRRGTQRVRRRECGFS
jgi:hypothetical protein